MTSTPRNQGDPWSPADLTAAGAMNCSNQSPRLNVKVAVQAMDGHYYETDHNCCVYTPAGQVWAANGDHGLVLPKGIGRVDWTDLWERVALGTEHCYTVDCDVCAEVNYACGCDLHTGADR